MKKFKVELPDTCEIHIARDGNEIGVYAPSELLEAVHSYSVWTTDHAYFSPMTEWVLVDDLLCYDTSKVSRSCEGWMTRRVVGDLLCCDTSKDSIKRSGEGIGGFVCVVGAAISSYFLFFYKTSVSINESGSYISGIGTVGAFHGSVNNIGLMQNQQMGLTCGCVILVIGVILAVTERIKAAK